MSRRVLLLADASPEAGLGHLARSTGLAQALGEEKIDVVCTALGASAPLERGGVRWTSASDLAAIDQEPGPDDIVVLDSYALAVEYVRPWAREARVVAFWDYGEPPQADLVISIALEAPGEVRGLSGLKYACLAHEYWQPPSRRIGAKVQRILVAAGGTDSAGISAVLADSVRRAVPDAEIALVLGRQGRDIPSGIVELRDPSSLRDHLLEADLIVTAAGQTMLEALASGTPCIALPVVPNQRPGSGMLTEVGAACIVEPGDPQNLRKAIAELAVEPDTRRALSNRGMECVDGRGALRLAAELSRLGH